MTEPQLPDPDPFLEWPLDGDPFPGEILAHAAWIVSDCAEHIAAAYQRTLPEGQRGNFAGLWQLARKARAGKVSAWGFRSNCLAATLKSLRRVGTGGLAKFVTPLDASVEDMTTWVAGFGDTPVEEVLYRTLLRSTDPRDIRVAHIMLRRSECPAVS